MIINVPQQQHETVKSLNRFFFFWLCNIFSLILSGVGYLDNIFQRFKVLHVKVRRSEKKKTLSKSVCGNVTDEKKKQDFLKSSRNYWSDQYTVRYCLAYHCFVIGLSWVAQSCNEFLNFCAALRSNHAAISQSCLWNVHELKI